MDDQPPPPSRRDHLSPAAGHRALTDQQRALRDAYLAELWPVCRELPWDDRQAKYTDDRLRQRQLEDQQLEEAAPTAHLRAAS